MQRFSGKVAVVTGAAGGIGRVYAEALLAQGASVTICDINEPLLCQTAPSLSGRGPLLTTVTDVSSPESCREMVAATVQRFGRLDILINNAGLFANIKPKPIDEISLAEWDRIMAVNLRGTFCCTQAVVPEMKRLGYGKIVNIASTTVFTGTAGYGHYVGSKAGVIGLTRSLASELGPFGIRVNVVAPGLTDTEAAHSAIPGERHREVELRRALRRAEEPEDLVGPVLFFCHADSDFVTGQCLLVEGGLNYQ